MLDFNRVTGHHRSISASTSTSTTKTHSRSSTWGSIKSFMTDTSASSDFEPSPPPSPCEQDAFRFISNEEAKATGVEVLLASSTLRDRRKSREPDVPLLSYMSDSDRSFNRTSQRSIVLQQAGSMDVSTMKNLINSAFESTTFSSTTSFSMSPNSSFSSLKPHTIVDAMEYLSLRLSEVTSIVLVVDFYMLEELDRLTPILSRFYQLQNLVILDSQADPPNDATMLKRIVSKWGQSCPSLSCVKFSEDTRWIKEECALEKEGFTFEWAEFYGKDDVVTLARNPGASTEIVEVSPLLNLQKKNVEYRFHGMNLLQHVFRRS